MPKVNDVADRTTRWMRWIARIWAAVIIAIVLVVVVGRIASSMISGEADPYAVEDYPPIENLPPIFALLSALGLGIAWRWEGLGGAIAVGFSLAALPVLLIHWPIAHDFPRYLMAPYGVWMIGAIPGILFLICWWRSKRRAASQHSA
ncbi:MAG: hypothetical protein ACK2UU_03645 [Anaerolineae bacterium]